MYTKILAVLVLLLQVTGLAVATCHVGNLSFPPGRAGEISCQFLHCFCVHSGPPGWALYLIAFIHRPTVKCDCAGFSCGSYFTSLREILGMGWTGPLLFPICLDWVAVSGPPWHQCVLALACVRSMDERKVMCVVIHAYPFAHCSLSNRLVPQLLPRRVRKLQ